MKLLFTLLSVVLVSGEMDYQMSQSAQVAEMSLSGRMNECLLRSYCLVGAHPTRNGQLAQGIVSSVSVLKSVLEAYEHSDMLVNMQKLSTSFDLGATTRDVELCHSVFRCNLEANLELPELTGLARTVEIPNCDNLGAVCPGVGISCALCGMFLPGTCGLVCPIAGIFCGSSGYLCQLAPAAPAATEAPSASSPPAATTAATATTAAPTAAPTARAPHRRLF